MFKAFPRGTLDFELDFFDKFPNSVLLFCMNWLLYLCCFVSGWVEKETYY